MAFLHVQSLRNAAAHAKERAKSGANALILHCPPFWRPLSAPGSSDGLVVELNRLSAFQEAAGCVQEQGSAENAGPQHVLRRHPSPFASRSNSICKVDYFLLLYHVVRPAQRAAFACKIRANPGKRVGSPKLAGPSRLLMMIHNFNLFKTFWLLFKSVCCLPRPHGQRNGKCSAGHPQAHHGLSRVLELRFLR